MKFKIRETSEQVCPDPEIEVWLELLTDGSLALLAGKGNSVLVLRRDGLLHRCTSIPSDLGFQLDDRGRVVFP